MIMYLYFFYPIFRKALLTFLSPSGDWKVASMHEHRRPIDKPTNTSKPTTVSEHFLTDRHHTTNDISLIP